MANVQLRQGMEPLFHCRCKLAVVTTPDGLCLPCEKGQEPTVPGVSQYYEKPPKVDWKAVAERTQRRKAFRV